MKKILFSLLFFLVCFTSVTAQTWTTKASLPSPRSQHAAVGHPNGKVYIFGGYDGGATFNNTVIAYDPVLNTHTIVATMPVNVRGLSYTLGTDNLIYIISGFNNVSGVITSAYKFDVSINTFSTIASIPFGCWEASATTGLDGRIFVFGGESTQDKVQIYNPITNTWSEGASIPVPTLQHKAITGNDGKIYVIGGNNGFNSILNTVQIYNPITNVWSSGAAMPVAKNGFGVAKTLDGKIYVLGGKASYYNNGTPVYDTVNVYDPTLNSWTSGNSLPIATGENAGAVVNNVIYEIGGTNGAALSNVYSDTICLTPVISCSENISISNIAGQCGANVTYPAATGTGTPTPTITYSIPSGSLFSVGTTTVTATATNDCGAQSCTFTVTVNDTQAPTISCGGNTPVIDQSNAISGTCNASGRRGVAQSFTPSITGAISSIDFVMGVDYGWAADLTLTLKNGNNPASGTVIATAHKNIVGDYCDFQSFTLPPGTNLIAGNQYVFVVSIDTPFTSISHSDTLYNTYSGGVGYTDGGGGLTSLGGILDLEFNIYMIPANSSSTVATSPSGAVVNYIAPVGSDNCPGATTIRTAGLASGATFPIGTTTVTHQVTDAAGLTAECSFTVTVSGLAPVIACPSDITVNNTPGQCGANVSFAATETTGFPASIITYSPASGSSFPVGTTTVTATATNSAGSSSCTFTVTVNDTEAPSFLPSVPSPVTLDYANRLVTYTGVSINGGGTSQSVAPGSSVNLAYNMSVSFNYATGYCPGCVVQNYVGVGGTNQTIQCEQHISNGFATSHNVDFTAPNTSGVYFITQNGSLDYQCNPTTFNNDASNAIGVIVVGSVCHDNITVSNTPGQCGANVSWVAPIAYDTCGSATVTCSPASGSFFATGTTTVTSTANDGHGNTATCNFDVTVNDTEAPSILPSVASPVTLNYADRMVTYTGVSINGGGTSRSVAPGSSVNLAYSMSVSFNYGTGYCPGCVVQNYVGIGGTNQTIQCEQYIYNGFAANHNVSFTAPNTPGVYYLTQNGSLDYQCNPMSFNNSPSNAIGVIVVGSATVCPDNITVNNTPGQCGANVSWVAPIATDNCGSATLTFSPASGSFFDTGTTTVTSTADDGHGNTTICTFDITVNDTEAPVINCPAAISAISNVGCGTYVVVGTATATDNCGVDHIDGIRSDALALSALYPIDVTTINWTATDIHGNVSAVCTQTITVTGQQAIASPASQTICSGSRFTTIVISGSVGGTIYNWTRDNTATVTGIPASGSGNISGSLTNTTNAPVTVTFTITPTANGCQGTPITATIIVNTVSVAPTSITSSVALATPGSNFTLSVNGGSLGTGASWKWYTGSCGGTLIGTGATISVSELVNTTYYVRAEGTCNITNCTSLTVNIKCGASSITSSSGSVAVCAGSVVTLTPVGGLSTGAQWRWDDDCDAVPSTSDSSATYTTASNFNVSPSTTTTYYLQSVGGVCGVTSCVSVTVTVIAKPATPGTISGLTTVCPSTSSNYIIVAVPNATSYTWTAPTNATITAGQGTTTVTVTYSSGFSSGTLSVKANNCSGSGSAKTLSVSKIAAPLTPGTISGLTNVCPTTSSNYSIAAVANATSYTWTAPTNATITAGQGTISVTVAYASGFTSGTLSVTARGCGGTSAAKTLTITKTTAPATPGAISGLTNVCPTTSSNYSIAAVANATSYTWTAPTNASITAGQGTTSVTVVYAIGFTSGTLNVTATGCGGTSAVKTLAITKIAIPATPEVITGASPACAGSTQTYSVSVVTNATSYTWTLPIGMSFVPATNTTGNSIQVVVANNFSGGTLSVKANNCSGSSANVSKTITTSALPTPPGAITGPIAVCKGAKVVYSVAAASGFTFNWTVPSGSNITSGTGTNSIKVTWGSVSGNVSVTKANGCSNSAASTLAVISRICRDDVAIARPFNVIAYPIPFADSFNLDVTTSIDDRIEIKVYDMIGKLIETRNIKVSEVSNQEVGNNYPSGVYNILVTQGTELKTLRVIKR